MKNFPVTSVKRIILVRVSAISSAKEASSGSLKPGQKGEIHIIFILWKLPDKNNSILTCPWDLLFHLIHPPEVFPSRSQLHHVIVPNCFQHLPDDTNSLNPDATRCAANNMVHNQLRSDNLIFLTVLGVWYTIDQAFLSKDNVIAPQLWVGQHKLWFVAPHIK